MAQWKRDPKARRNIAYLLAAVEVAAVTANFYPIFSAYLLRASLVVTAGSAETRAAIYYAAVAATVLCFVVAVFVGIMYARNRSWARWVFIIANAVLLALGVVWFVKNQMSSSRPEMQVAASGLLLPIVTLFPLLWPLIVFRPALRAPSDHPDAG